MKTSLLFTLLLFCFQVQSQTYYSGLYSTNAPAAGQVFVPDGATSLKGKWTNFPSGGTTNFGAMSANTATVTNATLQGVAFTNFSGTTTITVDAVGGGTGASCSLVSPSDDSLIIVTYTSGLTPTASSRAAVITFANAKTSAPRTAIIQALDNNSATLGNAVKAFPTNFTTAGFELYGNLTGMSASQTAKFAILVIQ